MIGRIGIGLLTVLSLVAIGLASWEPLTAERMTPPPPHRYDTVVARDEFGVPHVFGRTDPDVAYGIAYAHAEDDFPTIEKVLAMTRGRAGAIDGAAGAAADYALHLIDARATVARDYMGQPADVRALLDGYASGVNAYARRHPDEVRLDRLFPVNGADIATGFVLRSPFFFGLDQVLAALTKGEPLPVETAGPAPDVPDPRARPPAGEGNPNGSNAFAVAPRRSRDGFTRLVSNSHQPWSGEAAWYELVVHSGTGWNFAGATFPGVPFPLLGHNETLGWTNTVNRPDLTDIYRLRTNAERTAYRFDGRWRPLERRRIWLRVKLFGPFVLPVPKTVLRSVQGPAIANARGVFAIRYAGADQLRMVEEYYRLNRARDFGGWERALALQGVPATNFVYGDAKGHIALVYNAMFPNRKPGFDYAHILPGDSSADYAPGTVPWGRVPQNVDPGSGFLVNANDTPYQAAGGGYELDPARFSPLLGIETDTTNRATRALELMGALPAIGADDLRRIKYDTGVSRGSWAGRWFADLAAVDPHGDRDIADAEAVLARWDWNFDGRGPGDALALILMRAGNKFHYRRLPEADPRTELTTAARYLRAHFGRIDPPLGTVLRLRHGRVDLPLDGGPDVLRAVALWDEAKDGRLVGRHGDSFLMFMAWDRRGRVSSRSIQPYGAATSRPASPHYADQAPLFAAHRTKPVRFTPADLRGHVTRVYRP